MADDDKIAARTRTGKAVRNLAAEPIISAIGSHLAARFVGDTYLMTM